MLLLLIQEHAYLLCRIPFPSGTTCARGAVEGTSVSVIEIHVVRTLLVAAVMQHADSLLCNVQGFMDILRCKMLVCIWGRWTS